MEDHGCIRVMKLDEVTLIDDGYQSIICRVRCLCHYSRNLVLSTALCSRKVHSANSDIRKNTCAFSGTYRTLKSKKRFISENKAYKSKSTWDFFMPGRVA
jgi:hypothetical protein